MEFCQRLIEKIVILGVHINETCFKTGCVRTCDFTVNVLIHLKVASSNTSRLEAHEDFFILLMKWIFDPYVCISIVANNFFYCTFTYLAKLF